MAYVAKFTIYCYQLKHLNNNNNNILSSHLHSSVCF